jgi:uncharacterized protein
VVDGHCHPLLPDPYAVTPEAFRDRFSEGRPGTMAAHVTSTAYYARALRGLARRFSVEPTIEAVLSGRRARGLEIVRRWVGETRMSALLVDTGYPPDAMPLPEMRRLLPCGIHEVVRIETAAQELLARGGAYDDFLAAFRRRLEMAVEESVALKTIVAYRSGLAIREWPRAEVVAAYQGARARVRGGGTVRLTEKPLLDALVVTALDVARASGRPLQVHAGFGDPDIDLPQANPLLLRPVLEDPRWAEVRLVVLHMAYPYAREAAFLAAVWPQVYVDLSLALPILGPGALPSLVEILSLAPAGKLLYGSDLGGLPELFPLAAEWGRAALGEALGWLVARGGLDREDAEAAAAGILSGNARALYRLPAPE